MLFFAEVFTRKLAVEVTQKAVASAVGGTAMSLASWLTTKTLRQIDKKGEKTKKPTNEQTSEEA